MGRAGLRRILAFTAACMLHTAPSTAQAPPSPEGWVVLPVDEYRALRERALPPPPPPTSPVEATLTRVDYDLRVEGDAIAGSAILTIDVLRDGWAQVQIPAGLMTRDARLDGEPVPLIEGPPPYVLLARAGRAVLRLEIVIPLSSSAGSEVFALPPSSSPITSVVFALPTSGVDLSTTGGFVAERSETPNESRWSILGRPNQPITLTWKRRVDDRRADQPLRFRARVTQMVGLAEEISQVTASVRIDVLQGLAREVALALPPELVVNQVDGATVADWGPADGGLWVRLLDPVATTLSFVVQADLRAPRDGRIAIPVVRVPAAERESGGIAIDVVGAGEMVGRHARGLEPADPSELGDVVAGKESPSMAAFRRRSGGEVPSLTVDVVRYTPQAVLIANVEEARYRALTGEDGRILVEARYAVRNNQRSFLKVTMPAGARVWSASVAGRPTRPGAAEANAVLLPLEKGRAGTEAPTFIVSILYVQATAAWPERGRTRVELPALDLPVSRSGLQLHYSPRYLVVPEPGMFRLEADPGPFAEAFRRPATMSGDRSAAAMLSDQPSVPPPARSGVQALIDQFRAETGGRTIVGVIPLAVSFPTLGPSVFLMSELTPEDRAPIVEIAVKRARSN
jgi:hypothetical protein